MLLFFNARCFLAVYCLIGAILPSKAFITNRKKFLSYQALQVKTFTEGEDTKTKSFIVFPRLKTICKLAFQSLLSFNILSSSVPAHAVGKISLLPIVSVVQMTYPIVDDNNNKFADGSTTNNRDNSNSGNVQVRDGGIITNSDTTISEASTASSTTEATVNSISSFFQKTTERLTKTSNEDPNMEEALVADAQQRILTLSPYFNEVQRHVYDRDLSKLQLYLNVIAEQEDAFQFLTESLHPTQEPYDITLKNLMLYEAQSIFLGIENVRNAALVEKHALAEKCFADLLLSYDRFLKAGDLYPSYDPFSSYEVFYRNIPQDALPFDRNTPIKVLDSVVFTNGPDMGKTGEIVYLNYDNSNTLRKNNHNNHKDKPSMVVVKLDRDGREYQEVKIVPLSLLAHSAGSSSGTINMNTISTATKIADKANGFSGTDGNIGSTNNLKLQEAKDSNPEHVEGGNNRFKNSMFETVRRYRPRINTQRGLQ